ncbi:MAG: hypothetical protein M5U01_36370 [Ardenticatenaceae bacterium]|nr:hypothetical protein [Ardenticatenaceae bacterium]HBY92451.1 hypothetical protein [Chloroflexota bacterium]
MAGREASADARVQLTRQQQLVVWAMNAIRPLLEPPGTARDLIAAWKAAAELLATLEGVITRRRIGAVLALCEREHSPCPFGFPGPGPECVSHVVRGECEMVQRVEERWQRLGLASGDGRLARFHPVPDFEPAETDARWADSTTRAETQALLSALVQVWPELRIQLDES